MLDFNAQPINIELVMDQLIDACETGELARVEQFLQMPGVLEHEDIIEASCTAAFEGHLDIINHFLEIPEVFENTELLIETLSCAVFGGRFNVINRLLQTHVTLELGHDNAYNLLVAAIGRSDGNTFKHVNRLLEIAAIRDNAHGNNNIAFRLACGVRRLDIANRLLEIPRVSSDLITLDREGFLSVFINVLNAIKPDMIITPEEKRLISKLRCIGEYYGLSDADFTNEQHISILQRAREDMLSILLDALDSTPEERLPIHRFTPAYHQATSSMPVVSDDEMNESPSRCHWRCR